MTVYWKPVFCTIFLGNKTARKDVCPHDTLFSTAICAILCFSYAT